MRLSFPFGKGHDWFGSGRGIIDKLGRASRSTAILEFDLSGRVLRANPAILSLLGYTRKEVIGCPDSMFLPASDASREAHAELWRRLKAGKSITARFDRIGKNGRVVSIEGTYRPILDRAARPFMAALVGIDVTATALQLNEQAAQVAAIGATHAMLSCALDGTILSANEIFLRLMETTAETIVGQNHRMLVAPHQGESAKYKMDWDTLRDGRPISGEFPHIAASGHTVWLQGAYSPVLDPSGQPAKIIGIGIDITAAKEKSVNDAGQVSAIGKSHVVVSFDVAGTVLSANENFLNIMGYTEAEVVGQHHRSFMDPEEATSPAYHLFWQQLSAGGFQAGEFKCYAKNGEEVWFQASYNPVFDSNNQLIKVVKFATNLTAGIKRRNRLKLLSLLADKSDVSFSITDPESRIIYVNPGYERMTGFTAGEVIGVRPGDVANGPATDTAVFARIKAGLASGKPFREEILVYTKDKRPFWISVTMNPVFDDAGKLIHFVAVHTDITNTKQDAVAFNTKLQAISESSAMAEWTADGVPISANALVCDNAKFDLALSALLPPTALGHLQRNLRYRKTLAIPRDGHEPLWVDASFSLLADLEGRPARILMCGTDITARRKAVTASIASMTQMVQRITGIMQTIGRFASQTNLLALNAAIEAARAHRSGSEFALIAQEIRKLSVEASVAINQISTLLSESQVQIAAMSASDGDPNSVGRKEPYQRHLTRPAGSPLASGAAMTPDDSGASDRPRMARSAR